MTGVSEGTIGSFFNVDKYGTGTGRGEPTQTPVSPVRIAHTSPPPYIRLFSVTSTEMLINMYETSRRHIPGDSNLY
jgi:hypothetical protein